MVVLNGVTSSDDLCDRWLISCLLNMVRKSCDTSPVISHEVKCSSLCNL